MHSEVMLGRRHFQFSQRSNLFNRDLIEAVSIELKLESWNRSQKAFDPDRTFFFLLSSTSARSAFGKTIFKHDRIGSDLYSIVASLAERLFWIVLASCT